MKLYLVLEDDEGKQAERVLNTDDWSDHEYVGRIVEEMDDQLKDKTPL